MFVAAMSPVALTGLSRGAAALGYLTARREFLAWPTTEEENKNNKRNQGEGVDAAMCRRDAPYKCSKEKKKEAGKWRRRVRTLRKQDSRTRAKDGKRTRVPTLPRT